MTLRHYGKFKNEEVIILGYRKSMNSVMICRSTMLPADEQAALRQIASSAYAQSNCDYLIPILEHERHKSGQAWFSYLAQRLHRNDGSVVVLPLKEIMEMDPDQKALFKGWGSSISEAAKVREEKEAQMGAGHQVAGEELPGYKPISPLEETQVPGAPGGEPPVAAVEVPNITEEEAKPYVDREAMMLQLMQKMVEGQQQIAESIAGLEKKVAPRKTTRKKTTARKKATAKPAVPTAEDEPATNGPAEEQTAPEA